MDKRVLLVMALFVGAMIILVLNLHRGTELVAIVLVWYIFGVLIGRVTK